MYKDKYLDIILFAVLIASALSKVVLNEVYAINIPLEVVLNVTSIFILVIYVFHRHKGDDIVYQRYINIANLSIITALYIVSIIHKSFELDEYLLLTMLIIVNILLSSVNDLKNKRKLNITKISVLALVIFNFILY